jgi:hypothetical protein
VNGQWVTQASDIADATQGDAATAAHVAAAASAEGRTVFTEGPGSGTLSFMDRTTNTVWALVPQVTIPPRTTVRLLVAATFDNTALGLADGAWTRTEVLVTFGNHPVGGPYRTDENVDINGNGVVDPEEAKVRSVSTRFVRPVPAPQIANAAVTLADTGADLAPTGTVTVSNPQIALGATSGTVTVAYDPGASGGAITNCAHATGTGITDPVGPTTFPVVAPVVVQACDTQVLPPPQACAPGEPGCGWYGGDMLVYTQSNWGEPGPAAGILDANYSSFYSTLIVGDLSGYSMFFGGSQALRLPPRQRRVRGARRRSGRSGVELVGAVRRRRCRIEAQRRLQ